MAGSVKPTQLTTYNHVGMDGWMDTANKVCISYTVAIEPLLELDFYLYRFSFLFSSMLCLTLLT